MIFPEMKRDPKQIEILKTNLENQLDFVEKQLLPNKKNLRGELFQEQIEVAEFYLIDLEISKEEVKEYKERINKIKEGYGK